MANPNLLSMTSLYGEMSVLNATTASANIAANTTASGEIYRINSLYVSNINSSINSEITIDLVRDSISYAITTNLTIPYAATVVAISKDSKIYLNEGDTLKCISSTNSDLQVVCAYEVIA